MDDSSISLTEAAELRKRAEEKYDSRGEERTHPQDEADLKRLVHELEVHQIELEMQNEELNQAWAEVEAGLERYTELYDFAPVGYFTLGRDGTIGKVNLRGAYLLGLERANLVGRRFGLFVEGVERLIFNEFLERVFNSGGNEVCEVTLIHKVGTPPSLQKGGQSVGSFTQSAIRIEAKTTEDRISCRVVMIDITESRRLRQSLHTSEEKYHQLFLTLPISAMEVAMENQRLVIVEANDHARQTYGDWIMLKPNSSLQKIFAPDQKKDIEIIKNQMGQKVTNIFESNHIRANGEVFPVRIKLTFDAALTSSHFHLMIEDITAEKNRKSQEIGREQNKGAASVINLPIREKSE
jgi:PAS domain-containing protein